MTDEPPSMAGFLEEPDEQKFVETEVRGEEGDRFAYARGLADPTWNTRKGLWQFFYASGQLQSEVTYVDGRKDGVERFWFENGQLGEESHHHDGYKTGKYTGWWDDGRLRRYGELLNGEYVGRWWLRNRDDTWFEADTVDGNVHGLVQYYRADGTIFCIAQWERGTRVWQAMRKPAGKGWRRAAFGEDDEPSEPYSEWVPPDDLGIVYSREPID